MYRKYNTCINYNLLSHSGKNDVFAKRSEMTTLLDTLMFSSRYDHTPLSHNYRKQNKPKKKERNDFSVTMTNSWSEEVWNNDFLN